MRILIVDDQFYNLSILSDIIESLGYEYKVAADGGEAIIALEHSRFNLVLMDISMPNINGFEAIHYIRTHFDYPLSEIPVVAMTGINNRFSTNNQEFQSAGFSSIIDKPFSIDKLIEIINTYSWKDAEMPSLEEKRKSEMNKYLKGNRFSDLGIDQDTVQ